MSYLNINYSTLEDAWGKNFEKKKKHTSKDICNLYNKRHSPIYKPYKTTQASSHVHPIYADEDYTKYYGYKDGRPFSRTPKSVAKYKVNIPFTKSGSYQDHDTNAIIPDEGDEDHDEYIPVPVQRRCTPKEAYAHTPFSYIDNDEYTFKNRTSKYPILIEQEDDDHDEYFANQNVVLDQPDLDNQQPNDLETKSASSYNNKYLYEIDYDDDFDGYFNQSSLAPQDVKTFNDMHKKPSCANEKAAPSDYTMEEDQYDTLYRSTLRETYVDPPFASSHTNTKSVTKSITKDHIHFDLALYTISGIILIFVLEQFIQIGSKIKRV